MKRIDTFLNKITMYRLVLYVLVFLLAVAAILGTIGVMPYSLFEIAFSTVYIFLISFVLNKVLAYIFKAPSNSESTWITALILALIISPPVLLWQDAHYMALAGWASGWAIASKYLVSRRKKHIFNPAAFGVAATGVVLGLSASWWVGTLAMAPFVLVGGLLIVRKIRRFDMWWAFMLVFLGGVLFSALASGKSILETLNQSLLYAPALFFSTIMLTEPLTAPPTRWLRVLYGALVGLLFLPDVHFGSLYLTPELALLLGNVFSYLVSSKDKLVLVLREVRALTPDVREFSFAADRKLAFAPGQYMEWTFAHERPDTRGMRRYFTIASSPTEQDLKLGVKFYTPSSTYKQAMQDMRPGDTIVASQLAGDFTLPKDTREKLVFIAGGIGSTPFRSMVGHLLDTQERRPITLIYQNKTPADVAYHDLFRRAEMELGMKYVPLFDFVTEELIEREVPDYRERTFYISGPEAMVSAYKSLLLRMGVSRRRIKSDYFPGF